MFLLELSPPCGSAQKITAETGYGVAVKRENYLDTYLPFPSAHDF